MPSLVSQLRWKLKSAVKEKFSKINPQPVLVLGNQKSGTTAVAALLGLATRKTVQEDIFCWQGDMPFEFMKGKISFPEYLRKSKQYYSRDIIKEPSLTFFYDDFVKEIHPSAVIFILRSPFDNIRSILNRLKVKGTEPFLSENEYQRIKRIHQDWFYILKGDLYKHAGKNHIESLALRFNKTIEVYQVIKEKCITIKYEDFKKDKVNVITQLANQIGVQKIEDILSRVDHQFQPKGEDVEPQNFFSAENYKLIEEITRNARQQVGYI